MIYYLSLKYGKRDPDGSIPPSFDIEFPDSPETVAKRVTVPNYHEQIPKSKLKLVSSQEVQSPYRKNMMLTVDTYEITKKTYESMEEKPTIGEIKSPDGKKKVIGWLEHDHQDDHSEVRKYIIKNCTIDLIKS